MKDIAILISTYNGEKYLEEQLNSILSQTLMHRIDIWIRDDGSSDNTVSILKKYADQYENIYISYESNVGCTKSFFNILEKVDEYAFYAFSDQDDIWMPDKIQKAINKLSSSKGPTLYGACSSLVNNDLNIVGKTQICRRSITYYNALIQNLMPGHTQVFNHELKILIREKMDYTNIIVHDYWLTLVATAFGTVIFDNEASTLYRQHDQNKIGYGYGKFGWITERLRRVQNQAAKEITQQNQYFLSIYKDSLKREYRLECERFLLSQSSALTRIHYLIAKKVYRQKKIETLLFEILYLVGGYKI